MSDTVLPPKKAIAARTMEGTTENGHANDKADSDSDFEEINVFNITIVEGKRERKAPAGSQKLQEWMSANLEEKEDKNYKKTDLYDAYLEGCAASATSGVPQYDFFKALSTSFPKGFAIKEDSVYKGVIKERKVRKKNDKPKAPSLKLKMKDIISRIIQELGNPYKGIRFPTLKMHIAAKYPALRIEMRPGMLKNILNRLSYYGSLELVKGVGAAGFYRLPGPEMNPDGSPKDPDADDKTKAKKEEGGGDAKKEGEEDAKKEEGEEGNEEGQGDGKKEEVKEEKPDIKPKAKRPTPKKPAKRREIIHSQPKVIEDIFPLAMTYMSEPKMASARSIKKYILDHYRNDLNMDRYKKVLTSGEEKGFWECVRGDGLAGTYQLTIEDFDPTDDDDLTGQIVNAITACNEPKQCSSQALRSYITDFHTEFKVAEKPYLFKKAVERAVGRQELIQISGLGISGSFQLDKAFIPSPAILSGRDTASDYESSSADSDSSSEDDQDGGGYGYGFKLKQFQDAYVPRATKRRGKQRAAATKPIEKLQYTEVHQRADGKKEKRGRKKKKVKYAESSSEEEEESSSEEDSSEEEAPPPKRKAPAKGRGRPKGKAPAKPAAKKGRGRQARKVIDHARRRKQEMTPSSSEVSESDSEAEVSPVKKKRGPPTPRGEPATAPQGKGGKRGGKAAPAERKPPPTKASRKAPPAQLQIESESEEEEEEPAPRGKRGRPAPKGKSPRRDPSSEDESEAGRAPAKKRGRPAPGKKAGKGKQKRSQSSDDDDSDLPSYDLSPSKPSGSKKGRKPARDDASDSDVSDDVTPTKKKGRSGGKGRGTPKRGSRGVPRYTAPSEEDDSDDAAIKAAIGAAAKAERWDEESDVESLDRGRSPRAAPKKSRGKGRGKGRGRK